MCATLRLKRELWQSTPTFGKFVFAGADGASPASVLRIAAQSPALFLQ
jgi:hypothetical protein